jgi:hypothetical protein
VGPGARVGTGSAEDNLRIARTNFVGALAQCEAAVEIFRNQNHIRTEMLPDSRRLPFEVDEVTGSRAMVVAIESEAPTAVIPAWPWKLIGLAMRNLPLRLVARMS